ncbi:MAG TPA: hypothetical protein VEB21_06720 [Terriglobales bacterium]|nr:hypothetical protein [Terriglobales bacterium]
MSTSHDEGSNVPGLIGGIGGVVIALIAILIGAAVANMSHHAGAEAHAEQGEAQGSH